MKQLIAAGMLFFISNMFSLTWAISPSFDCAKASQRVERVICKSDKLARQDLKLNKLYRNVLDKLTSDLKKEIKSEQRNWLKKRNKDCQLRYSDTEECLLEFYRKRNTSLSALLAFDSSDSSTNSELSILRVTPQGNDVLAGQQVVFQFDRPVVPIGQMARESDEIPVSITPTLNCEWRWLNTSALSCQLREEDKMKQATLYEITMKQGIKTENGAQLKTTFKHSFTTTRPKITYTRFVNWLSPGTPLIQVTFNQPVTKSSVESTMTMAADAGKPISVIAYPDNLPRQLPWWMAITNKDKQPKINDQLQKINGEEARKVWVVEPTKELPLDSSISFDVSPGLKSSTGKAEGVESRTVVSFDTYPEFEFIGIRCTLEGERQAVNITASQLGKLKKDQSIFTRCAPLRPVAFIFSSPVLTSIFKKYVGFKPRLDGGRKDYDPWENSHDWSRLTSAHRSGREYQIWLPELLQAYEMYSILFDTNNLKDEFNRTLKNKISFDFFTSHRQANLKINHQFAVLEKGVESEVPLYVTNLDDVTVTYSKLGDKSTEKHVEQKINVNKVEDVSYAVSMGVRKLLDKDDTGIIYAALSPNPTPPNWYRDPKVLAQVTPYQVHFKLGHFNSQVWVTKFSDGEEVKNAKVSLLIGSYEDLTSLTDLDIKSTTDKNGLAMFPGMEQIDPDLQYIYGGYRAGRPGFFVKIEHDDDIAVLPLNNNFSIRSRGSWSRQKKKGGHTHTWGTTAQGIYKLGDTVQFKIYVRDQSNKHWVSPVKEAYKLQVTDPQRKTVYEINDIKLNEFGSFDGEFTVPDQGAVGWYKFKLMPEKRVNEKRYRFTWAPMSVLISDFTPAPFKVSNDLNGDLFKADDQVEVTALATLHSGGPFTDAEIRLTAKLKPKAFITNNPIASGFRFGSSSGKYLNRQQSNLLDIRGKLDDFGQYENVFVLPVTDIYFGSIVVESAVKDDRGKFVASSSTADYAGRDRFVGLRNTNWLYKKNKIAKLESLVVDQKGNLVSGVDISITINHREYKASRVKGPGNAYLTQNIMEWVEETNCSLKSKKVASTCEFKPKNPGYYQFIATIKDSKERDHKTTLYGWVTGSGNVIWDQSNDATLQIIPEQTKYKIGDTARYLIKNPYPGAKALVTVERYGILDSWVETLETSTPVIKVPVKPDYLPGFYLSVVILSPRVEKPLGPNKVDLGKPSYRMGYVKAKVSDPYKELEIKVSTDKEVYKPRDKVKAEIKIISKNFKKGMKFEVAVAVVDESVFALNRHGENYYDPYAGFNRLDTLDVKNFSLISRLVGRQKFEKKGANPGGGGGGSAYSKLRNRFKFVSYWNPSIKTDSNGKAQIEFDVPDNLTGWRIFAFAVTEDDKMGLGDVNFKVNRPTEIRPVMPNQVIEGDSFKAGFSVMNRTKQLRKLKVDVIVDGPLASGKKMEVSYNLDLAAFKRKTIWVPIKTKGSGELKFIVDGKDKVDGDAVEHTMPVNKRRSLETAATYGTTTNDSVSVSIKVPKGIHTDVGYIGAVLSPSIISNLDGAFKYVKDYPYFCWEQRLTKAVMANSYTELKEYLNKETIWASPKEDVSKALSAAANFQAPNGGMAYWVPSNSHVSPYLSAYTAIAFNWLRRDGHKIPNKVEERLHDYLLNLLRRDEFPTFYSKGMSSSVRAVALAALAESGKITAGDIERYERHVPEMDLFGKSHFLQAAIKTEGVAKNIISTTTSSILGHASQTGGKFQFNEPWDDSYKYILATPMRSNCSVLSSLISVQAESSNGKSVGDIPFKLVRSITQSREDKDHWENTQENVFCLNALIDYASIYEKIKPSMKVKVRFNNEVIGSTQFSSKKDPLVTIKRGMRKTDEGLSSKLEIEREGDGRLYYSARIAYDLKEDNASRINSGIEIRREYSVERDGEFVILNSPMNVKRGELVKVDLFISVPTARHFVVVNDPIPGGLEPVNTDLATASKVDADKAKIKSAKESWFYKFSNWSYYGRYFWSFYHKELRHDSARFYADYLPAGNYQLSYTSQVIAEGDFTVMPVHVEEMYDPDVYGKGLPATLKVNE